MKNLQKRTIRAAGWVMGLQIANQILSFAFGIALARLLSPDDFGLVAMVVVFTAAASLLAEAGFVQALIQKKDTCDEHYHSVFWVNLIIGCTLGGGFYMLSSQIGALYMRPEIEGICKVLAFNFPLIAIIMVPRTLLTKELILKHQMLAELSAMIISSIFAILLAVNGFGYWSLVAQRVISTITLAIILWSISTWRPRFLFVWSRVRELLGFSSKVFAAQVLNYVGGNLDKLILGKVLGGHSLGIYDKSNSLVMFPMINISRMFGGVMFPSLSLIQSDVERVKKIYLRSISAVALITFPIMTGILVVAEPFVLGVFGSQWAELIPVLQILSLSGILTTIATTTESIFLSQGAVGVELKINFISIPIRLTGIIIGLNWGLIGVAVGLTLSLVISSLMKLSAAGKLINLPLFTQLRELTITLIPSILMGVTLWLIEPLINFIEGDLQMLFLQAVLGGGIYLISLELLNLKAYLDLRSVLIEEYLSWKKG
jgi:O-antigen/teichoic acid export membrane protein